MHIGQRISLNGFRGTTQYIGTLDDSETVWIGIEWDDKSRGKHSGEYKDESIFHCRPGHGSFLKQSKVKFDQPRSLEQAIRHKYLRESAEYGDEHLRVQGISRPLQTVGFDKARQQSQELAQARQLSLASQLVDSLDIGALDLSHLVSLDLSWNLINDLRILPELCCRLPNLRNLDLEGNRFLVSGLEDYSSTCNYLKTLSINLTYLSWPSVLTLTDQTFPHLSSLQCAKNDLHDLPLGHTNYQLEELNLHDNKITNLHTILETFVTLTSLDISNNNIQSIQFPQDRRGPCSLLRHLNLANNPLKNIQDISNLQCYPCLESLQYTLLLDDEKDDLCRLQIIQYLPQLKVINRSTVTQQERHDAFALAESKSRTAPQPHNLANDFITLRLQHDGRTQEKKVLQTQTIKQLKGTFARFAKLKPMNISRLKYTLDKDEVELDDDLAQISYYSLADGGIITMASV